MVKLCVLILWIWASKLQILRMLRKVSNIFSSWHSMWLFPLTNTMVGLDQQSAPKQLINEVPSHVVLVNTKVGAKYFLRQNLLSFCSSTPHSQLSVTISGHVKYKNNKRDSSCTYTGHLASHYWECSNVQLSSIHTQPFNGRSLQQWHRIYNRM